MRSSKTSKRRGRLSSDRKQEKVTKKPKPSARKSANKTATKAKVSSAPLPGKYPPFIHWLTSEEIELRAVKDRAGVAHDSLHSNNIHRLTKAEIEEHFALGKFGVPSDGFVIPYYDLDGFPVIDEGAQKAHRGRWYVRIRLDKSAKAKYLQASDTTTHPYFPKGLDELDASEIVLVEGEMKAISLVEEGIAAVGIGGFYGWSRKGSLNPDFRAALKRLGVKRVLFLGDNDTSHNWQFSDAAVKLAKELHPIPVHLPQIPLSRPKGIDDVKEKLKRGFPAFWRQISSDALLVSPELTANALALDLLKNTVKFVAKAAEPERLELFCRFCKLGACLKKTDLPKFLEIATLARFKEEAVAEARALVQSSFKKNYKKASESETAALKRRLAAIYRRQSIGDQTADFGVKEASSIPAPFGAHDYILLPSNLTSYNESARSIFSRLAQTMEYFLLSGNVAVLEPSKQTDQLEFHIVSADMLRSRLAAIGTLVRYREALDMVVPDKRVQPKKDEITTVLTAREVTLLPRITAIHNSPVVVDDGAKLCVLTKGYHKEAGGRYITDGEVDPISLREAVKIIKGIFDEFMFVSESDKARTIAALITPAMHFGNLVKDWDTPIFIVEADASQAGKGYLLQLIQQVYNEQCSIVAKREGGVGSIDESLSRVLVSGKPFITIDNFKGALDSSFLEAILTCPANATVPCRVPFQPEIAINPRPFIFQLTTNGFTPTSDLANRMCMIRILKRSGYLFREYDEGSLRAHVAQNRRRFLGAVFAVISHWYDAGKPVIRDARGEGAFRKWWEVMNWILINVFEMPSPLDDHSVLQSRLSEADRGWLEQVSRAVDDAGQCGVKHVASAIAKICTDRSIAFPTASGTSKADSMIVGQILARVFTGSETRLVGGYRITRQTETMVRAAKGDQVAIKYYTFEPLDLSA